MRGTATWLPSFGAKPRGRRTIPITMVYSILILPPTLRAVQGCSPYVRTPINTLSLASPECLPYNLSTAAGLSHYQPSLDTTFASIKLVKTYHCVNSLPRARPMLHALLRHKIHFAACLSPVGYSTVFQDLKQKTTPNPSNCIAAIDNIYDHNTTLTSTGFADLV